MAVARGVNEAEHLEEMRAGLAEDLAEAFIFPQCVERGIQHEPVVRHEHPRHLGGRQELHGRFDLALAGIASSTEVSGN